MSAVAPSGPVKTIAQRIEQRKRLMSTIVVVDIFYASDLRPSETRRIKAIHETSEPRH